jgi:hypothetical protein
VIQQDLGVRRLLRTFRCEPDPLTVDEDPFLASQAVTRNGRPAIDNYPAGLHQSIDLASGSKADAGKDLLDALAAIFRLPTGGSG